MEETATNVMEKTEETSTKVDKELVEKVKNELIEFGKSLEGKVYPVGIKDESLLKDLVEFIENEAEWSNLQAIGVVELSKNLRKAEVKNEMIMLKALEIDATYFFLSKKTGKGLLSAQKHISLIKPFDLALKLVKQDNDKMAQIESRLAAAENGIEVDFSANQEKPTE